jgi:septal ring factor EnvC (AmiA/AmiB activator)
VKNEIAVRIKNKRGIMNTKRIIGGFAVFCMIMASGLTHAQLVQPQQGQAQDQPAAQGANQEYTKILANLQELRTRSQQLQGQLSKIEQAAKQKKPELATMQNDLTVLHQKKLKEVGYPDEEQIQKLRNIQQQLQTPGGIDDQERQQLTQRFNAEIARMQKSQETVRRDPEIREESRKYEQARMKAMTEVDGETPELQRQLSRKQQEFEQWQQKMQQQSQSGR